MILEQKKEKIIELINDLDDVQEKTNELFKEFSSSLCKILEEFRAKYNYMLMTEADFEDVKDFLYLDNDAKKKDAFETLLSRIIRED